MKRSSQRLDTLAVHAGDRKRTPGGTPVTTPIHTGTSFFHDSVEQLGEVFDEQRPGYTYTRFGNPTVAAFEEQMAVLEGAEFAFATSSGMAATQLAISAALMDRRRSVLAGDVLYGQTLSILTSVFEQTGVQTRFVSPCDVDRFGAAIEEMKPGCVVLESITNPLLRVAELDRICEIAHCHGSLVVVDATFSTPVLSRPLELGADIVYHSVTKYIAGHGDVLGGVVLANAEMRQPLQFLSRTLGASLGPFEAYLAMRGAKTLPLRFERQCRNARAVAAALAQRDDVEHVYFPGDPRHPDHEIAKRLFPEYLFGAVVSIDLSGGREQALAFMNALEMVVPSTSVGDVHTLALYPPMSTHRDLSAKHRKRIGIGDGIVRLSIGIEAVEDILDDLGQALLRSRPQHAAAD